MEVLNKKVVLVTGGSGLVGSHLVELLLKKGARVVVIATSNNPFSYFVTQKLFNCAILIKEDVRASNRMFDIIVKYEIEYIFHLAAQPIVDIAYNNPLETITTNIIGTTNILDTVRRCTWIKGLVVASSDKAYGKLKKSYIETDPLLGDHPYEVSKSSADMICNAYFKTYNIPVVVTRFGNIYGPGDLHLNRIIPGIMSAVLEGSELVIRSNGKYIRDYIYVKDVASAYVFLMEHLSQCKGQAYNIGSYDSYSVIELISVIEKILKIHVRFRIADTAINEIPEQSLKWDKIMKLGWKPNFPLKTAIIQTYDWYKHHGFI